MARYLPVIQKALHELFSADFEVVVLGEGELEDFGKKNRRCLSAGHRGVHL